ncbi:MAG: DEAD/DEAH box helicase family protein [Clostridium sp.]|uniref:DEAD/DEAH box helicase family protein n=1 Tax=Clostridium sp. TaxID=1506 RepID=UPI002908B225|nr:DEAD/DEAH box helicase family protein [Clostridium sp.]MDU7150112.1 DEAD/DEAH box helicase family protein [Clostridium sp.]
MSKKINNSLKDKQINYIENLIINDTNNIGQEKFILLNNEAGMGKTTGTEKALVKAAIEHSKKSILVRYSCNDGKESMDRMNSIAGKEIAFAYNTETKDLLKEFELNKYPILIITHQRYKLLSKRCDRRRDYTKGRSILVIDEEIDIIDPINISIKELADVEEKIHQLKNSYIIEKFNKINKDIKEIFIPNRDINILYPQKNIVNELQDLISFINANISLEFDSKINMLVEELNNIKYALNQISVMDNKIIKSFHPNVDYWGLETNLILDACSHMNELYKFKRNFILHNQQRVFNYSNWTFNITNINSCKSSIDKADNYYREIDKHLKELSKQEVLLIASKDIKENNILNLNDNVKVAWFGNVVGKNDWRDFTQCYIILNPQIPFSQYILKYLFYAKDNLNDNVLKDLTRRVFNKVYRFNNPILDKIRVSQIAMDMYQAVKRINRSNERIAKVYIVNHDKKIVDMLLKEFQGCKTDKYSLDVKYAISKAKEDYDKKRVERAYYTKFINLLKSLPTGRYSKNDLREKIGYENKKNFNKEVLKKEAVINYCLDKGIEITARYIIIK